MESVVPTMDNVSQVCMRAENFCYPIEQAYIMMSLDLTSSNGGLHSVSELIFSHFIPFR